MKTKLFLNPEFKHMRPYYEQWRDLYEGDQPTMKSEAYLWRHEIERTPKGHKVRAIREQRSSYTNHIETLVSQWTSLLFKSDPLIPPEVLDLLGDAMENIDGKGTSLISFLRDKLIINSLVYGRPILYVGAYGTRPANLKEQASKSDFRPYFEALHPLDLRDWEEETSDPARLGRLNWVRTEYTEMIKRESAEMQPYLQRISKQYRVTPEGLEITRYEQAKVDPTTNSLKNTQDSSIYSDGTEWNQVDQIVLSDWDEIPMVVDLKGTSWVKDIAPHALKYYNTESVLDNIILFQAYQRIIVSGDLDKDDDRVLAENTIAIVPTGTSIHTIEPVNLSGITERLSTILNNIYRLGLNQVRMMSADSAAVQAADTIREEKDNVAALVQSEMENLENIVNHGVRLYAKYLGINDFESNIEFNAEIEHEDIDKFIRLVMAFKDEVSKYPSLKKAQLVKYVQQLNLPNEEELLQEIEAQEMQPVTPPQPAGITLRDLLGQQDNE